jgi:pSer/pThr/pTyr-binding forkhead associated (FHA) protein
VLKLTIEDDEGKTTVIPVIRDEMTIGRQEGNTIRLTERNVSRRHARLLRQNGVVYVEDLASFTGVKLNGSRIAAVTPIREGDELHIGDYKIVLKSDRPADVSGVASSTTTTKVKARTSTPAMGSRTTPAAAATSITAPAGAQSAAASAVAARISPPESVAVRTSSPEPIEAQPTIPVRTLGDLGANGEAAPTPARLVVLSTELAGMEFMMGRASVVIGRTDENDIQLNHRSISRHHAKVVRDGDRYTIVDLQSANGVRVNGDDYERIELNPGDILELGHVKMRFVGPFELYVFDPATAATLGEPKISPRALFTIGGGLLFAVLAILVQRSFSHPKPTADSLTAAPPVSAPVAATAPAAAPAAAAPTSVPPSAPTAAGAPAAPGQTAAVAPAPLDPFAKIARDSQNEDWVAALATIRQLNAGGVNQAPLSAADRARLLALFRKAETERKGSAAFAKFDEASSAKDYGGAIDWFEAIPPESMYKQRAASRYQEARTLFVSEHLLAAEKFRTQGKCVETRHEADEVTKVDPTNQLIKELVKLCKPVAGGTLVSAAVPHAAHARVAAGSVGAAPKESPARPEAPATPRSSRETTRTETAAAATTDPAADPDLLLKQAREAWLHQQCGSAIDIARRALKAKPSLTDAYQIITVCSCSLRDADGAGRAYGKLDDKSRTLARSLCQKNGISLGGE